VARRRCVRGAYIRGALITRSADLATADISAGATRYHENRPGPYDVVHRIPAIVARDRDTGRPVKIPLRGRGLDLLPRAELVALADALTVGRPAGPEHKAAHAIAERLRQLADDPLAV
jgi:hypothetical protein